MPMCFISRRTCRLELNRPNLPGFGDADTKQSKTIPLGNIDVSTTPNNELGLCPPVEHAIELTDKKPVRRQVPYTARDVNRKFVYAKKLKNG